MDSMINIFWWSFFISLCSITVNEKPSKKLVCYVETWASTRSSPMNYNLDYLPENTCNYLVVLYVTMDPQTWGLKFHNGYNEFDSDYLTKAVLLKERSPNMKVLVSVGGWEDGVAKYSDMISEKNRRAAFVVSVVQMCEDFALDGLELHWLYPGVVWRGGRRGDKANFLQLVKELTREFKPKKWILTASVPPDESTLNKGYHVARLNSYLHQFHVRTVDLRGDWTKSSENHCPLFGKPFELDNVKNLNVNDSLSLWERKRASRHKLLPTFPLFGRTFTLKDAKDAGPGSAIAGAGKAAEFTKAMGIMAYYEICDRIQQELMTYHFESETQTPYAVGGDQWVGFDDEISLQKKTKFLDNRGFGGAALFAVSLDDFTGLCGEAHFLLKSTKNFFRSESDISF